MPQVGSGGSVVECLDEFERYVLEFVGDHGTAGGEAPGGLDVVDTTTSTRSATAEAGQCGSGSRTAIR